MSTTIHIIGTVGHRPSMAVFDCSSKALREFLHGKSSTHCLGDPETGLYADHIPNTIYSLNGREAIEQFVRYVEKDPELMGNSDVERLISLMRNHLHDTTRWWFFVDW